MKVAEKDVKLVDHIYFNLQVMTSLFGLSGLLEIKKYSQLEIKTATGAQAGVVMSLFGEVGKSSKLYNADVINNVRNIGTGITF